MTLDVRCALHNPPPVRPASSLVPIALALTACSHTPPSISLDITTGQETSAFTADPPVTRVDVEVKSLDGTEDRIISAAPGDTFNLGSMSDTLQVSVEVTGYAADGTTVLRGRSLSGLLLSSVVGGLPIFAQRVNQWARPPSSLVQSHVSGVAAVLGERYLVLAGGTNAAQDTASDATKNDFYDLLELAGQVPATADRVPESLVSLGSQMFSVNETGATMVNYEAATAVDATLPTGLMSFADVAGGRAIGATNGRTFLVGATRADAPTTAVLEVDADGTLRAYSLKTARKGAAATWVNGVGLVVVGGSDDPASVGLEVLAETATSFESRGFPADSIEGADGTVLSSGTQILLVGGWLPDGTGAPTRLLDPSCFQDCPVKQLAPLPTTLGGVTAYALPGGRAIVVGDEPDSATSLTRSFLVDVNASATNPITEVPFQEPRRHATSIPAPNGTLAVLGGEHADGTPALSVELFFPQ